MGGTSGDEDGIEQYKYAGDPRGRQSGLLTYDDREYLLGQKSLSEAVEAQSRQRLRDRVRNGLLDFELLLGEMEERDVSTIFSQMTEPPWPREEDISEVYWGTKFALAFLYQSVERHAPADFATTLEDAIELAEKGQLGESESSHYGRAEVTVDIDIDRIIEGADPRVALQKLRNGDSLTDHEIAALVRYGDMKSSDWEMLRELQVDIEE